MAADCVNVHLSLGEFVGLCKRPLDPLCSFFYILYMYVPSRMQRTKYPAGERDLCLSDVNVLPFDSLLTFMS